MLPRPAELLYLPGGDVPSAFAMVPSRQQKQLLLSICIQHDGLSLRATTELDAHVAFLYGASVTPLQLWLFAGAAARRLQGSRQHLLNDSGWPQAALGMGPHGVRHVLLVSQRDEAGFVADLQGQALWDACDLGTGSGKRDAMRFCGVVGAPTNAGLRPTHTMTTHLTPPS
jgi:hypothetical protein